jgi:2-(1,2-epoxy-1,2-dihydrophenyl)acetyl-CoA isomerase
VDVVGFKRKAAVTTTTRTVATLTLNRPQRLNALTEPLLASLARHLAQVEADDDVRGIMLTGAGGAFCTGQDLNDRDPRKVAP